jgi:two-component system, LytTR family, sensor histidine kinase AlgZ
MHGVVRDTLEALALPRRLVPILLVCAPLVAAQGSFSADPLAVPLAVLTCVAFVCLGPLSWRVLFADDRAPGQDAVRLLLFAGVGAGVVLTLGLVVPKLLGMGATFLTTGPSLAVSGALFLAGGWGLGRDIGLEESLAREKARVASLAREAEQAQLLALRAHLDPHFLFNTLNAIAALVRDAPAQAEEMVVQLSDFFRRSLAINPMEDLTLSEEVDLQRLYLEIERTRFPERLRFDVTLDDGSAEARVPALLLQPLVENAVKHGVARSEGPTCIRIRARLDGPVLEIVVENDANGARPGSKGEKVGLRNVQDRLRTRFGDDASLATAEISEGGFRNTVRVPLRR